MALAGRTLIQQLRLLRVTDRPAEKTHLGLSLANRLYEPLGLADAARCVGPSADVLEHEDAASLEKAPGPPVPNIPKNSSTNSCVITPLIAPRPI